MNVSQERTDGYVDLRSYAAIGDGRTVALIALDGSIDWLPIPSLDSVPVFARLLDADHGGSVELAPAEPYTVTRRYITGTNVLVTTFTTRSGIAKVTDALLTGVAGRLPWVELARRVDGVRGAVKFRWRVAPGTGLGTAAPWVDMTKQGKILRMDGVTISVSGIAHGERGGRGAGDDRAVSGTFTTSEKSRHLLSLVGTADEPLHIPVPELIDIGVDRTIADWRAWSRVFSYSGPWAASVQRSALALKLLIYAPTGAIAAASTTSLPENVEGGKNWDYRYAWVRDVAYTVHALIRFGLREETHAAVAWLLRTIRLHGDESDLGIFYTLDGKLAGDTVERDAPGWRGIGPVIKGNPAREQQQHGIYGDLLAVMLNYVEAGNVLDTATSRLLASVADLTCDIWRQPDSGMWELPQTERYTSSAMGCWQALDAAIRLHEMGQVRGHPERWAVERDSIAQWVRDNCWSESQQSYVAWPGTENLDASVLLHAPSGFDRGTHMSSTIDAIREQLGRGPLLYRYTGVEVEEGAFVACAFWAAASLACVGRHDEAAALMDELVGLGNDVGIFAEMIEPSDLSFLGNLPQGLSHLALVNAAITIHELAPEVSSGE
ncbi:glycoside hydrolase family 15 protein [soil metagenome]